MRVKIPASYALDNCLVMRACDLFDVVELLECRDTEYHYFTAPDAVNLVDFTGSLNRIGFQVEIVHHEDKRTV